MARLPTLSDGLALTHFIVAEDVDRAARFYSDVLGGEVVLAGEPTVVALANSWIIVNVGGGPTDDKPGVTLEPPRDPDRVSSFLTSASQTSRRPTGRGASEAPSSSHLQSTAGRRPAATFAMRKAT
jgi:hypothetical protein